MTKTTVLTCLTRLTLVGLLALLVLLPSLTLFEDGSVQLFGVAGWGLCLLRAWGC